MCISFCSVSDKSGASLFLPCSHKKAVAHMNKNMAEKRRSSPILSSHFGCACQKGGVPDQFLIKGNRDRNHGMQTEDMTCKPHFYPI